MLASLQIIYLICTVPEMFGILKEKRPNVVAMMAFVDTSTSANTNNCLKKSRFD